ncbi:MAG: hypothetical protein OHK0023_25170 [Anaerolineae bacterium]
MRPRQRRPLWSGLVVIGLALLVCVPLIARSGLPSYNTAILTELRGTAMAELMREGILYSRFAPDFGFRYGSAVFNYLPPLAHWLLGLHQAITEATPESSLKLWLIVACCMASLGMYVFGRGRFGERGGIVSAGLYLFSTPLAYQTLYLEMDLSLLLGLAFLPWAAAGLDQLKRGESRSDFFLAVAALAALFLSETRLAFFGSAALVTICIGSREAVPRLFAAWLTAFLITAFFWAPAAAERNDFRWFSGAPEPISGSITLQELFSQTPPHDFSRQNADAARSIGFLAPICAILGILGLTPRTRGNSFGLLILAGGLVLLATPLFGGLFPPAQSFLPLTQYHAALAAFFCFAGIGGGAVIWLERLNLRGIWLHLGWLILVWLPSLLNLPIFFPPLWSNRVSLDSALAGELSGLHFASLREGVLQPISLDSLITPLPNLSELLDQDRFDWVDRLSISGGSQISLLEQTGTQWRYVINSFRSERPRFYLSGFLGWHADLGGRALTVENTRSGFFVVNLTAANAELTLRFGETTNRTLGWIISIVGIMLALWAFRQLSPELLPVQDASTSAINFPLLIAAGLGCVLIATGVRVFPQAILLQSPRGTVPMPITALPRFTQAGIDLIGYQLSNASVVTDGTVTLQLVWQPARPVIETYQSELHLIDLRDGRIVARTANRHPGRVPTLAWLPTRYIQDTLNMHIPAGLRRDVYALRVVLGVCRQPTPLPCSDIQPVEAYDPFGKPEGPGILIPEPITIQ